MTPRERYDEFGWNTKHYCDNPKINDPDFEIEIAFIVAEVEF